MSYAIFDCSQFLTFNYDKLLVRNKLDVFEGLGMKVLLDEEIAKKKLEYLKPFLREKTVELIDQEFVGVFEDWREEEDPPIELIHLKKEIADFCDYMNITSLKFIIISCASEQIHDDAIIEKTIQIDQFYSGLFVLSKWNFKEVTDNLILTINL